MVTRSNALEDQAGLMVQGWGRVRPEKKLFGLSVGEFSDQAGQLAAARARIRDLMVRLDAEKKQCQTLDKATRELITCVEHAVMGDPEEGPGGELYAAMGLGRKSTRSRRRRAKDATLEKKDDNKSGFQSL